MMVLPRPVEVQYDGAGSAVDCGASPSCQYDEIRGCFWFYLASAQQSQA